VIGEDQRPHPRQSWQDFRFEDAADNNAIGEHVEIVIVPFA
jgi:hypothetical protein